MKRLISSLLVFQFLFMSCIGAKASGINTDEQSFNIDQQKICCYDENGVEIFHHAASSLGAGPIVAIVLGSVAALSLGSAVAFNTLKSNQQVVHIENKKSSIAVFNINSVMNHSEFQELVSKVDKESNLIDYALSNYSTDTGNEIPVALVNKTSPANEKIVLIRDFEIKNNQLHLYSVKLLEELNKTDKLSIETTLVYNSPEKANLDLDIFKNSKANKFIDPITTTQTSFDKNLNNEKINIVQKEFKVSTKTFNAKNPLVFGISTLNNVKNSSQKVFINNYAVLVRIKPV